MVLCKGLPCLGFPEEKISPTRDLQIVEVPFIMYRGVHYVPGYALLERIGDDWNILDVKHSSQHLRRRF